MSENFYFFVYVFTKEKLEGGYTLFSSDTSTVLSIVYLYISAVEHESS